MRALSKSKLLAYRQCRRRLWLEIHHPELREDSKAAEESYEIGHQVGDLARKLYDPEGTGVLIDVRRDGLNAAFAQTDEALRQSRPIFEAAFTGGGALALADVMIPRTEKP